MKSHLFHSIIVLIVLYSQLYNSVVTAVYEINYDYYAEVLCENKDRPELHCDGKCYFAKQLALEEGHDKNAEPPALLPVLRLFSTENTLAPGTRFLAEQTPVLTSLDQPLPEEHFLSGIDHPPRV